MPPAAAGAQRERGGFREGDEPGGKLVSPRREPCPTRAPSGRGEFFHTESDFEGLLTSNA